MTLENQRCSVPVIFKEFGNVHEPDIIKRIFFYLDYESFKNCQRVSRSWRSLLTSETYISMGKIVFQKELVRIKGPVWFVKISREVSPTQVALLSAFVANGRR